jgi:hypothetical protein
MGRACTYADDSLAPHTHKVYTNILTPPAVPTLATTDVESGPKVGEDRGRQAFSENVSELRCRRNMKDTNIPKRRPCRERSEDQS